MTALETMSQATAAGLTERIMRRAREVAARDGRKTVDVFGELMRDVAEGHPDTLERFDVDAERRAQLVKSINRERRRDGQDDISPGDLDIGQGTDPTPDPDLSATERRVDRLIAALAVTKHAGERRSIVQKLNALLLVD